MPRHFLTVLIAIGLALLPGRAIAVESEAQELRDFVLRSPKQTALATPPSTSGPVVEPSVSPTPRERLSLGINYTGGQIRWTFSRRWSAELRTQFGHATSDYGDVTANVFGLRGYRYFNRENRLELYVGPEVAYASAEAHNSSYQTSGIALGAFGGLRFKISSRFSIDTDLGPYVISLKEKQTGISSTNLDFVLNSALVIRIL